MRAPCSLCTYESGRAAIDDPAALILPNTTTADRSTSAVEATTYPGTVLPTSASRRVPDRGSTELM
jgi:hypothetical protein